MSAASRMFALARFGQRATALPRAFSIRQQSTYKKPAAGVNPAYDEALKIINAYKIKKTAEAEAASKELKDAQARNAGAEEISALKQKFFSLAVEAEINDSEVLWNARRGNFDITRPVYLHLKEQAWRARPLEVLMQRLLQMFVLPDLLDPRDVGTPEAQLNISLPGSSESPIEPGIVIDPKDARDQLDVELVTFHDEPRLHTLVMVDIDEPLAEQQTFREQFHWVVANVSYSKTKTKAEANEGDMLLPYIPPHPARGSPTHRYAVVAFEQGEGGQKRIEGVDVSRDLVLREFAAQNELRPVGISFFRANWSESVDEVYRDILKLPAPSYGPMPETRSDIGPDGRKINAYANY
ncbi:mitochondrial 54S ribosomal protein YmL35 [Dipsacomyces acuminosporus]|nr:mitochondrial 54S ribosomal protein YmL35 [Dipsacomyces acuminosporus]